MIYKFYCQYYYSQFQFYGLHKTLILQFYRDVLHVWRCQRLAKSPG